MGNSIFAKNGESISLPHVISITAFYEIFPQGMDISAVIIQYDEMIECFSLMTAGFTVEEHQIRNIYSNNVRAKTSDPEKGNYLVLDLEPERRGAVSHENQVLVKQDISLYIKEDTVLPAWPKAVWCTDWICPMMKDFVCERLNEKHGGLQYQLFVPRIYSTSRKYPLVLFLPDFENHRADAASALTQGRGGVIWATEEQQSEQESFVVIPLPDLPCEDACDHEMHLKKNATLIIDLCESLARRYQLDLDRLYMTAQSEGCAMAAEIMRIKPGLFSANFLVAARLDPQQLRALAKASLCLVAFQEDEDAYSSVEKFDTFAKEQGIPTEKITLETEPNGQSWAIRPLENLFRTADFLLVGLKTGEKMEKSLLHKKTWEVAYEIVYLREWLFMQKKKMEETRWSDIF